MLAFYVAERLTCLHSRDTVQITLVMKHDVQEGAVHPQCAIVVDKAQLSELVHKEIDAGPGRADHLSEHVLTHVREGRLRFTLPSKIRQ
jgi:hypothetical protein